MTRYWWVAIAALLYAGDAGAQGRSGFTEIPLNNVKPFRELRDFGDCLARAQRKPSLALIATKPGSAEEAKILKKWVYGEHTTCLFGGTKMAMPDIFARGAIAEGLLRHEGVPATHRLPDVAPGDARDLHDVARCYTSRHRGEVQKLMQIHPGSREEVKAIAALWPDFRTCMPGFNVRLNAPWIRFLLAEALLRLEPTATTSGD
jgi:hypothetical protein